MAFSRVKCIELCMRGVNYNESKKTKDFKMTDRKK